jgi:hypothetical protein
MRGHNAACVPLASSLEARDALGSGKLWLRCMSACISTYFLRACLCAVRGADRCARSSPCCMQAHTRHTVCHCVVVVCSAGTSALCSTQPASQPGMAPNAQATSARHDQHDQQQQPAVPIDYGKMEQEARQELQSVFGRRGSTAPLSKCVAVPARVQPQMAPAILVLVCAGMRR